jgi:hypothetical protein
VGDDDKNKQEVTMLKLASFTRKLVIGAAAALTVAGSVAVSSAPAEAARIDHSFARHGSFAHHGHFAHRGFHRGGRWIGPAVATGLAFGLAAPYYHAATPYHGGCWVEHRRVLNRWGHPVVRRVQVCG